MEIIGYYTMDSCVMGKPEGFDTELVQQVAIVEGGHTIFISPPINPLEIEFACFEQEDSGQTSEDLIESHNGYAGCIEGENMLLPNGRVLQEGSVCFKSGVAFIPADHPAVIDEIRIKPECPTALYFDGKEHVNTNFGALASLGAREVFVSSECYLTISFLQKNNIFTTTETTFFELSLKRAAAHLQSGQTSVPHLQILIMDESLGAFSLANGAAYYDIEDDEADKTSRPAISAPLILEFQGLSRAKASSELLVFDGSNNAVFLPKDDIELISNFRDLNKNEALVRLFTDKLTRLTNAPIAYPQDGRKIFYAKILYNALVKLSPTLREPIEGIKIVPGVLLPVEREVGAGGVASGRVLYISIEAMKNSDINQIIAHEAAHALVHKLKWRWFFNGFKSKWLKVAGDVYTIEGRLSWEGSTADDPRYGLTGPYGAKNYNEDVATFVQNIIFNPKMFKPLIDPMNAAYDPRYLEKLKLLKEYDFITEAQYRTVVG